MEEHGVVEIMQPEVDLQCAPLASVRRLAEINLTLTAQIGLWQCIYYN